MNQTGIGFHFVLRLYYLKTSLLLFLYLHLNLASKLYQIELSILGRVILQF